MMTRKIFDLVGLVIDHFVCIGNMSIDRLLVVDVDERTKEDVRDTNECEAPQGHDFDQPVRHKGSQECYYSVCNVFGEQDSLKFDDEEVDQLLDIFKESFESLARYRVVALGPERRC